MNVSKTHNLLNRLPADARKDPASACGLVDSACARLDAAGPISGCRVQCLYANSVSKSKLGATVEDVSCEVHHSSPVMANVEFFYS